MILDRSHIAGICATGALAVLLAGCGSSDTREARGLSGVSILEKTKPLGQNLIKISEIDKASDTAGVKTLLQFWLTLQYQDYESATNFFYPELANFVGVAKLALALKNEAGLWSSTRPQVVEASSTATGAHVIVVVRNLAGDITPVTIAFRKLGTTWRINYFTLLDEALRAWAQQSTQVLSAPNSSKSAEIALSAGTQAYQLQSLYLEHEHGKSAAASVHRAALIKLAPKSSRASKASS